MYPIPAFVFRELWLAVAGWFLAKHHAEFARRTVRVLLAISGLIILGIAISGFTRSENADSAIHRWGSHGLIIVQWLFTPFIVGVALQTNMRRRPALAIGQIAVLVVLFMLELFSCFTGYLKPSRDWPVYEEVNTRFAVLHFYAIPTLLCGCLTLCYWLFRPRSENGHGTLRLPESNSHST